MYEGFAKVYDTLMADVDYSAWAAYYGQLAKRRGITVRRAADCACGTGSLTLELAVQGIQMTGLDLSVDMLRVAGEKARKRGLQLPFIRQDMRKLLLHRPMDAIFCACDGVNYLTRPEDVQSFFTAAWKAIQPGGGLFFDISTRRKLESTLGNNCLGDDGLDVSYIWQNHFEPQKGILQMDLTFFVREPDGRYARFAETHFQRAHALYELAEWLQAAGFTRIQAFSERTFAPPRDTDDRVHFAAIRP